MLDPEAIVIIGLGIVSPWGVGVQAFTQGVASRQSAVDELTLFEPSGACELAAEVPDFDYAPTLFSTQPYLDRATALGCVATREALDDAGIALPVDEGSAPLGLCLGSAWGCIESVARFSQPIIAGKGRTAQGLVFTHSFPNSPASIIAIEYGLRGYATVHAGSRLAGLWAMADAADALRSGAAEQVAVVATEALSAPVFAHHQTRGELSASGPPRPFATDADGTVRGEGAVCIVLETAAAAKARAATVRGQLKAWQVVGMPERLTPSADYDTHYVCATGLPAQDAASALALARLGSDVERTTSLTPLHGDALAVNGLFALACALTTPAAEAWCITDAAPEGAATLEGKAHA